MESKVAKKTSAKNEATALDLQQFVEQHESGLSIDKNALDEALLTQTELFYRVSRELANETSRRDAAKDRVKIIEAEVDEMIRLDAAEEGKKVTESMINSQKLIHKDVRNAYADMIIHNRNVALLTALKESYLQRSYALKELVSLYLASYYGDGSAGRSEEARNRRYDETRREMAEERKKRR